MVLKDEWVSTHCQTSLEQRIFIQKELQTLNNSNTPQEMGIFSTEYQDTNIWMMSAILYRCHVSNALPWKLTPPSICNNQLYYKVTPRVIMLWLPSHFATTGLHCKMTPHFEMTPNKQYYTSYVENNLWYCFIVFLSFMTKIHVFIAFRFWNPN